MNRAYLVLPMLAALVWDGGYAAEPVHKPTLDGTYAMGQASPTRTNHPNCSPPGGKIVITRGKFNFYASGEVKIEADGKFSVRYRREAGDTHLSGQVSNGIIDLTTDNQRCGWHLTGTRE